MAVPMPTIPDLFTVAQRKDRSTKWHELWYARSDEHETVLYEVRVDVAKGEFTCNCPATVACKHMRRVALYRECDWWMATLQGMSPSMLADVRTTRQARIDAGEGTMEDTAAVMAVTLLLGEGKAVAA